MFLVDDLLLGPGKAAMVVFKELARKAQEDWLDDAAVKQELQEIYALAEAGKISTQDFEARECRLLERLEQIARAKYNDKWGPQEESPVIEAAVVAEPLLSTETEPPHLIEPPPPVEPRPPMIAIPAPPIFEPPPSPPPPLPRPPAPLPSAPPPPPPQATVPAASTLSIGQVVENTTRALALLNLKLSVITSVSPEDGGWKVTADLIERRGVPDTNDLIGVYELRLDGAGNVTRYERTRMRRRGDLGR
jgi:hypothetical protein